MIMSANLPATILANASMASNVMHDYVTPIIATLCIVASLAATFFLVVGGIQYMTSTGRPERLERAKQIIKYALVGLALVLAAATLTAILSHAYAGNGAPGVEKLPALQEIKPESGSGVTDVILNGIVKFLRSVVESAARPFLQGLSFFLNSTPLMGDNPSVFNLWLAVVGVTDALFVLVVALLGFHIMSFSVLGFEEVDVKQLLPQFVLAFLLINTSIFAIDTVIGLSNAMIQALQSGFPSTDIWLTLVDVTKQSSSMGITGLLVMVAFLVVSVMLLIYYVMRLIALYAGAILSPLVALLWLLPAFKEFAVTAIKTYLVTIFALFVHVVILLLAASIFTGILDGNTSNQPNNLMALIVGLAAVLALLKTQGVMQNFILAASVPRAAKEVSGAFMRGVSASYKGTKRAAKAADQGKKAAKRAAVRTTAAVRSVGKKGAADQHEHKAPQSGLQRSKPRVQGERVTIIHGDTERAPKITKKKREEKTE